MQTFSDAAELHGSIGTVLGVSEWIVQDTPQPRGDGPLPPR
jgi:hypothetical protein